MPRFAPTPVGRSDRNILGEVEHRLESVEQARGLRLLEDDDGDVLGAHRRRPPFEKAMAVTPVKGAGGLHRGRVLEHAPEVRVERLSISAFETFLPVGRYECAEVTQDQRDVHRNSPAVPERIDGPARPVQVRRTDHLEGDEPAPGLVPVELLLEVQPP